MRLPTASAAALLLAAASQPASAATQPAAGIYVAQGVYTAVTATGGATDCPSAGDTFSFYLQYPGPATAGAAFYSNAAPGGTLAVRTGTFPTTPAAGIRNWGGTVHVKDSAGNVWAVPFAGVIKFFTASAFLLNVSKWNEPQLAGGACDEVIELSFIRTGSL